MKCMAYSTLRVAETRDRAQSFSREADFYACLISSWSIAFLFGTTTKLSHFLTAPHTKLQKRWRSGPCPPHHKSLDISIAIHNNSKLKMQSGKTFARLFYHRFFSQWLEPYLGWSMVLSHLLHIQKYELTFSRSRTTQVNGVDLAKAKFPS